MVRATDRTYRACGLLIGVGLMAVSLLAARTEVEGLRLGRASAQMPLWAWDASRPAIATGAHARGAGTRRALLDGCLGAMGSPPPGLVPPLAMHRAALDCAALSQQILRRSPHEATAHLTHALALIRLDRPADARKALDRARPLARADGWSARSRLRIAFDPALNDPLAYRGRQSDIKLVSRLNSGPRFLAGLHRTRPTARAILLPVLERQPARVQQAFLRALVRLADKGRAG